MMFLYRRCLLAGTLGLLVSVALLAQGQQAKPSQKSGTTIGPAVQEGSPAYQVGYHRGVRDRSAGREPSDGDSNWKDNPDGQAYSSGYHAGYCRDEKNRTGYYNGVYGYGPPVIRNGYYGYNAPEPYCENDRKVSPQTRGNPQAPQNRVEYAGGGS